jgi:hypothetical protein
MPDARPDGPDESGGRDRRDAPDRRDPPNAPDRRDAPDRGDAPDRKGAPDRKDAPNAAEAANAPEEDHSAAPRTPSPPLAVALLRGLARQVGMTVTAIVIVTGLAFGIPWLIGLVWR